MTIGKNKFSGTLPPELGNLKRLVYLDVLGNHLTGTFPESYKGMESLKILYLYENYLTGTVDFVCSLQNIQQPYLSNNSFSGTLPACIGDIRGLVQLYIESTFLTGPLPTNFNNLLHLQYLELDNNSFTSTIPETFGQIPSLTSLELFGNYLTGTVPTSISQLKNLTRLQLQDNYLSGPLTGLFNASVQPILTAVILSGNSFTGPIPEEPFKVPGFRQFSAGDNCMQGSIPEMICDRTSLNVFAIDGMGAGRRCNRPILPGLTSSYLTNHAVQGGIPLCLFSMLNITVLHLSGNGITGSLPEDLQLGRYLIDLALSHNSLSGSIPKSIQQRKWYNLDLSYNRFTGTMLTSFDTVPVVLEAEYKIFRSIVKHHTFVTKDAHLNLENNRLSGRIPSTVHALPDISILNGNLFGCHWDGSNLPEHDSGRAGYLCGSNSFNSQYYLWLCLTGLAIIAVLVLRQCGPELEQYFPRVKRLVVHVKTWWNAPDQPGVKERLKNFQHVESIATVISSVAVICTVYIVLVLTPFYASLSNYYGTLQYAYAWSVSAFYLSGVVPFVLVFLLLLFFLAVVVAALLYQIRAHIDRETAAKMAAEGEAEIAARAISRNDSMNPVTSKRLVYTSHAAFFTVNFVIVMGFNLAFVYVVLYADNEYLTFAQVSLSLFKGFWNSVGSVLVLRWAFTQIANDNDSADYHSTLLFASLINNIAIPCLVVALISPDCFYNVFVAPPTVQYIYAYLTCSTYAHGKCQVYFPQVGVSDFHPPFAYSYECASQYVMSYAPTFVYLAIEVTFILPLVLSWQAWQFLRAKRGTRWYSLLTYTTPKVLQLVDAEASHVTTRDKLYLCFDANVYLVQLKTYLGIIITFGAVFPPLAPAMLLAIASLIVMNRLMVGRYLHSAVERDALRLVDNIDKDCRGVGVKYLKKLKIGIFMLVMFGCCFYALFLFDILGDDQGLRRSFWVLILMPLLPLVFVAAERLRWHWFGPLTKALWASDTPATASTGARDVELNEITASMGEEKKGDTPGSRGVDGVHNVLHAEPLGK